MRTMDRYLFVSFLTAYMICFVSLVGLYVIIDLFSNADEFLEDHAGILAFVRRAAKYYFVHSFEFFGRLSPIITLLAAMTTLASLHRNNELVALLAAGISTWRTLLPVFGGVFVMVVFGVINRELILPANAELLQRYHQDIEADKVLFPTSHIDSDHILFRAREAHREDERLENVNVTLPVGVAGELQEIHCSKAYYRRDEETGDAGWLLVAPEPPPNTGHGSKVLRRGERDVFIRSDISFHDMIRRRDWINFASTWTLIDELHGYEVKNPNKVRIMIHNRLMQPVLQFLLVLIGIPFVLQWERKNIFLGIAVSIMLCGLFLVTITVAGYFALYGYISPLTAAWMPVFLFVPVALSLFRRIGT